MYDVEKRFDIESSAELLGRHKYVCFGASAAYLALVLCGRRAMETRAPYQLHKPLVLWNVALACFSMLGAYRTGRSVLAIAWTDGLEATTCKSEVYKDPSFTLWVFFFTVSKLWEFGDTAFVVLKKSKLTFLHCYHHITVFLYVWLTYGPNTSAVLQWFCCVNFLVHSIMYTYYGLRAAGWRLPSALSLCITVLQLLQMFWGIFVQAMAYWAWSARGRPAYEEDKDCRFRLDFFYYGMAMYGSYAVLFMNFFYWRYLR